LQMASSSSTMRTCGKLRSGDATPPISCTPLLR